jgi:hypothetical protein
MRSRLIPALACLALAAFLAPSAWSAPPEGWHKNIEEGLEASEKSGKPLLVMTAWAREL